MRYVSVLPAIPLINPVTRHPVTTPEGGVKIMSMEEYALEYWLNDPRWQKPLKNMASLVKVVAEFKKPLGQTMAFEDADYAVLRGIVETPFVDQGGNVSLPRPLYQLQLQPFADAILGASTTDPSVATAN